MLCGNNSTLSCPDVYCPSNPNSLSGGNYTASVCMTPTNITSAAKAIAHIQCSPYDVCKLLGCDSESSNVYWGSVNKTQLSLGVISYDCTLGNNTRELQPRYFSHNNATTNTNSAPGSASASISVSATASASHTSGAISYGRDPLDIMTLLFLCIFTMFIFKKA